MDLFIFTPVVLPVLFHFLAWTLTFSYKLLRRKVQVAAETEAVIYAGESAESEPRREVSMDMQKEIRRQVLVAFLLGSAAKLADRPGSSAPPVETGNTGTVATDKCTAASDAVICETATRMRCLWIYRN